MLTIFLYCSDSLWWNPLLFVWLLWSLGCLWTPIQFLQILFPDLRHVLRNLCLNSVPLILLETIVHAFLIRSMNYLSIYTNFWSSFTLVINRWTICFGSIISCFSSICFMIKIQFWIRHESSINSLITYASLDVLLGRVPNWRLNNISYFSACYVVNFGQCSFNRTLKFTSYFPITRSLLILEDMLFFSNMTTMVVFYRSRGWFVWMEKLVKEIKMCHIVSDKELVDEVDTVPSDTERVF